MVILDFIVSDFARCSPISLLCYLILLADRGSVGAVFGSGVAHKLWPGPVIPILNQALSLLAVSSASSTYVFVASSSPPRYHHYTGDCYLLHSGRPLKQLKRLLVIKFGENVLEKHGKRRTKILLFPCIGYTPPTAMPSLVFWKPGRD